MKTIFKFYVSIHIFVRKRILTTKVLNRRISGNDGHKSRYNLNWIVEQQQQQESFEKTPTLWTADEIEKKLPFIECQNDRLNEDNTKTLVTALLELGVAFVNNVSTLQSVTHKSE